LATSSSRPSRASSRRRRAHLRGRTILGTAARRAPRRRGPAPARPADSSRAELGRGP
jgi:hypothetical protein